MLHKLRTVAWHWLVGPFRHRRMTAFWLVTVLALGGTSAWLSIRDAQKVAAADDDALSTPPGIAPSCDVINVHDGDTMKLDCGWDEAKPQIINVRLHCIDAPELSQEPWGKLAREHLQKITGRAVAVKPVERDRYGRLVAVVHSMNGELGLRMVSDGFAPVYPKYCKDRRYYDAEATVRTSGTGIWSVAGAHQTPWAWRHR
jgi:endonuclease YncB( thermonuclease family)